jgi:hypothetical protein
MIIKKNMSQETVNKDEFIRNFYNISPHKYREHMSPLFADYFVEKERLIREQDERRLREKNKQS